MTPVTMIAWLKSLLGRPGVAAEAGDGAGAGASDPLGVRGENAAAKFLRNLGYRIIIRNFRVEAGEIDIIARDGKTLVFVEVKTRADDTDATPEDQVDDAKRHQISKVAKLYLGRYGTPQPAARFDVVSVVWPTGRPPRVKHFVDAFGPTF